MGRDNIPSIPCLCILLSLTFLFAQNLAVRNKFDDRPNFLIMMANDLGFSDTGPFGGEIQTPNIDNLARDGKILTNFHVLPACAPTRSELLTSIDNHLSGLGAMYEGISILLDHIPF